MRKTFNIAIAESVVSLRDGEGGTTRLTAVGPISSFSTHAIIRYPILVDTSINYTEFQLMFRQTIAPALTSRTVTYLRAKTDSVLWFTTDYAVKDTRLISIQQLLESAQEESEYEVWLGPLEGQYNYFIDWDLLKPTLFKAGDYYNKVSSINHTWWQYFNAKVNSGDYVRGDVNNPVGTIFKLRKRPSPAVVNGVDDIWFIVSKEQFKVPIYYATAQREIGVAFDPDSNFQGLTPPFGIKKVKNDTLTDMRTEEIRRNIYTAPPLGPRYSKP